MPVDRLWRAHAPRLLAVGLLALALAPRAVTSAWAVGPCIPGVICDASPSPSPSPSAHPSPSPSHRPSPQPTRAPAPVAAAPARPAASPSPSPSSSPQQVAAQFKNAPFLADLLKVLNHPASAQTPDLKHFRLEAARVAAAQAEAGRARRAAAGNQALTGTLVVVAWIVLVGAALTLARGVIRLPRWARRSALLLLPALAAGLSAGVHSAAVSPTVVPSNTGGPQAPVFVAQAPPPPELSAPVWQELVAVEQDVAATQDSLARQEDLIRRMAASPVGAPVPDAAPVPSDDGSPAANQDRALRVDPEARQARQLGRVLGTYHLAAAHYQDSLRREYEVYRAAAQDPSRKQQIQAAAASAPLPGVKDVVAYNLGVVQVQLDQEAQIASAEGKLAAIGSLSGAQLTAIRQHQAFIIPVEAPVIQGFGPTDVGFEPSITYHGTFYPHFHTGLDIIGVENSPVHAGADGVVLLATSNRDGSGNLIGYGNYVVIAHPNGFVTLYGHMNSLAVKEGQVVHQGEIVGLEGSTGLSTGPHVHFEIRHNNDWVDPAPYLTGQVQT
jgi:murein DD-endopeptidase MepM/ murein hydrolase activator NlpD